MAPQGAAGSTGPAGGPVEVTFTTTLYIAPVTIIDGSTSTINTASSFSPLIETVVVSPAAGGLISTSTVSQSTNSIRGSDKSTSQASGTLDTSVTPSISPASSPATATPATLKTTPSSISRTTSVASNTTSSAAAAVTTKFVSTGLSSGAAAGIGIGCAIIGALVAFALAWCILGRKRKNQRSPIPEREHFVPSPDYGNTNIISKTPLTEKVLPLAGPQSEALDGFLTQRADDSQLKKVLQDLNEIIDQHVENHYHNKPFEGNQGALERRLVECGYTSDIAEVTAILVNPQTRFAGIRQLIAKVIIGNTDLKARSDLSLLPPQIAAFYSSIPPVERQSGSEDVFGHVLSRWRYLTSYLLSPNRSSRLPPSHSESPDPVLHANITRNVAVINSALKLFINPGAESQRYQENNLSAIVFEGAKLGLLIFSQPSELLYRWTSGPAGAVRRKGKGFVVFPGLWESLSERKARDISQPVVIDL